MFLQQCPTSSQKIKKVLKKFSTFISIAKFIFSWLITSLGTSQNWKKIKKSKNQKQNKQTNKQKPNQKKKNCASKKSFSNILFLFSLSLSYNLVVFFYFP